MHSKGNSPSRRRFGYCEPRTSVNTEINSGLKCSAVVSSFNFIFFFSQKPFPFNHAITAHKKNIL